MLHPYHALIGQIHSNGGDITWNHIFREVNQVVNGMTKHAMEEDFNFHVFDFISNLFLRMDELI